MEDFRSTLGQLSDLSQLVSDTSVELFALHAQEVIVRLQDATFDSDGPRSVDVVSCHHADSDPGPLTLSDGVWYLMTMTGEKIIRVIHAALYR